MIDHEVFRFAQKMLQIFALALGLEETALDDTFRQPLTDITMQYYSVQAPSKERKASLHAHADYGGKLFQQDAHRVKLIVCRIYSSSSRYVLLPGSLKCAL